MCPSINKNNNANDSARADGGTSTASEGDQQLQTKTNTDSISNGNDNGNLSGRNNQDMDIKMDMNVDSKMDKNTDTDRDAIMDMDMNHRNNNNEKARQRKRSSPSRPSKAASLSDSPATTTTSKSSSSRPKIVSVIYMTLSMAVHFAGHEFLRSPTLSMFTSKDIGFESSAALPLSVGFVGPFSLLLLWSYTKTIKRYGPRWALTQSTIAAAAFMLFIGISLHYIQSHDRNNDSNTNGNANGDGVSIKWISKWLLFALFVMQSSNVQFLYTQHWSFIGSVLSPGEVARSGTLIAGIGSVTSTFAAANVSKLVDGVGLIGLLCTAAMVIGSSAIFADKAYQIANKNGFEPTQSDMKKKKKIEEKSNSEQKQQQTDENMINTSIRLFRRVPVLGALFCEVIIAQCLSSLLNFQFLNEVKSTILDDNIRAGWTGSCYAWINGVSGALQFFILPFVVKRVNPRWLWLCMPIIMICFVSIQFIWQKSSLALVGFTFFSMKTIEYSLRGQASEMLYSTLDFESRFIGKELINLLANRLGKSGTAVTLFLLTTYLEKNGTALKNFIVTAANFTTVLWLFASIRLTRLIPTSTSGASKPTKDVVDGSSSSDAIRK